MIFFMVLNIDKEITDRDAGSHCRRIGCGSRIRNTYDLDEFRQLFLSVLPRLQSNPTHIHILDYLPIEADLDELLISARF